jgi:uncharacterized protein
VYRKYLAVTVVEKKMAKDSADRHRKDSMAKANQPVAAKVATEKMSNDSAIAKKDTLTKKQKEEKSAWEGLVKNKKYDPKKDDGKKKAMRETSFGKLWDHLLPDTQSREAEWTYRIGIWELSMMMLLGMALFKAGFFTHRFSPGRYLVLGIVLCAAGLMFGWFRLYFRNATLLNYEKYITGYAIPYNQFIPIERVLLATGYTALVMWMLRAAWLRKAMAVMAKVGRLSLTNYLLQSIFCTLFFTGFGSGNFGKLTQWQLYLLVIEIIVVQISFSVIWLRHFPQGPAEWLLRCAFMRRWLPFRRQASPEASEHAAITS